jgi:hypothetical protein
MEAVKARRLTEARTNTVIDIKGNTMTPLNWIITYRDRLINRHRMSLEDADSMLNTVLEHPSMPWLLEDAIKYADGDVAHAKL